MFSALGRFLHQWWILVIGIWLAAFFGLRTAAPPFDEFAREGEFVFLPAAMPSRQGEALYRQAFPGRQSASSIVIVVHRNDPRGLTDDDHAFIDEKLKPALETVRDQLNNSLNRSRYRSTGDETRLMTDIRTFSTSGIGALLESDDHQASLVTVDLTTDFQDTRNWDPIQRISVAIHDTTTGPDFPKGLELELTGSATLGRDLTQAEVQSAENTGPLTICLVVLLLVVIYRAPVLALVPLLTLFISVDVSLHALTLLAQAGVVPLFKGLREYATVITYGPGIDYCLFLIARYKENILSCVPPREALAKAVGQVGSAIAASGATVICGIGMLSFAQFGKFHEAGIGISFSLAVTLFATLTLTPALLFLTGHWAFWPKAGVQCDENAENVASPGENAVQKNLFEPMWSFIGAAIERRPMLLLLGTSTVMLPFIALALLSYDKVNYGLLESLPKSATSVRGARLLEKHFPAGITGPVQVLLHDPAVDFREDEGIAQVQELVNTLMKRSNELKLADVRSVSDPLGMSPKGRDAFAEEASITNLVARRVEHNRSVEHYVSHDGASNGHVTELELILMTNPFSMESVKDLDKLISAIRDALPTDHAKNTAISIVGPTASVRDVSDISHRDQQRICLLVVGSVFVILIALLRTFTISLYLIVTVVMSYLCTLGMTWLAFYLMDPAFFMGLDWTVPLFLFVVLIAVGEDYNIFLVSRIHEEQKQNGDKHGITVALARTGGIITSCGFIMAGTFASLMIGSLARMQQLGFALALGVLLDTFIIRPILVPAFLMVLHEERYGKLARYLK